MIVPPPIRTIAEAVDFFEVTVSRHSVQDAVSPYLAALEGRRRAQSGLVINHLVVPDDLATPNDEFELPEVVTPATPVGDLARDIIGMLAPLQLLNPVSPCFATGRGSDSMVPSFGIPLNAQANNAPSFHRSIDDLLGEPPPDPEASGLLPEIRARIKLIKANTPSRFKIGLPGIQGPFNLAHGILGDAAFLAPQDDESRFRALMERITTFWIAVHHNLRRWIGEDRMATPAHAWRPYLCECSVNLVSTDFYQQFVLPHDRRIAEVFGPVHLHPCSGPHVFHATLNALPVAVTEAGYIAKTAAGAISVDEALHAIGDRPIVLSIGQELPEGREFEFIRADLDRYAEHPRLLFSYTGMHWRRKDRPRIRDFHRWLDDYWAKWYS